MTKVLQIATECYPAAKAGGMGDVVGSLGVYFPKFGVDCSVVIPKYGMEWFANHKFEVVFHSEFMMDNEHIRFSVHKLDEDILGYPFFCIDIPGKFDRPSIYLDHDGYGYRDEIQRNISFQRYVLIWLRDGKESFDLIHCHDHQTGLIPFFIKKGVDFHSLRNIPVFFSIHNGAYVGAFGWYFYNLLPRFEGKDRGLLDWDDHIHSMATGVKMADKVNTVSPSYMEELKHSPGSLFHLFEQEGNKCMGILNGIDTAMWDPKKDPFLPVPLKRSWNVFKKKNKEQLCEKYGIDKSLPLFSFIGRLAHQKGADVLMDVIGHFLHHNRSANFAILGSGDPGLEGQLRHLAGYYPSNIAALITYNEGLAHELYAASDFLLMPSRFEPCGLNQMFAMRYGTIPVVHSTGGLKDTVPDYEDGGNGIKFSELTLHSMAHALERSIALYSSKNKFVNLRDKIVELDYSWDRAINEYINEYQKLV